MKNTPKRLLSWLLVLCMVFGLVPNVHAADVRWKKTDKTITAELSDRVVQREETEKRDPNDLVRVSIVLEKPSAIEAGYATMDISGNTMAMEVMASRPKSAV